MKVEGVCATVTNLFHMLRPVGDGSLDGFDSLAIGGHGSDVLHL